jgi:hypothetical protein
MITNEDKELINKSIEGDNYMSKDFTEANYVISFINGQPGLVVRGEMPAEIEERMEAILPYFKKFRTAVEKAGASKSDAPKTRGMMVKCEKCGSGMDLRSGYSNKTKKNWSGYFCPNSTDDDKHPVVWA